MDCPAHLRDLNAGQRAATEYGVGAADPPGPLLVIAGAGTGQTNTLAHRVAHLLLAGPWPEPLLLLPFTRLPAAATTGRRPPPPRYPSMWAKPVRRRMPAPSLPRLAAATTSGLVLQG